MTVAAPRTKTYTRPILGGVVFNTSAGESGRLSLLPEVLSADTIKWLANKSWSAYQEMLTHGERVQLTADHLDETVQGCWGRRLHRRDG